MASKNRNNGSRKRSRQVFDSATLGLARNIRYDKNPKRMVHLAPPLFTEVVTTSAVLTCSAAGGIASALSLDPIAGGIPVNTWATRYGACFTEYRTDKIDILVEGIGGTIGETLFALDDSPNGAVAPSAASIEGLGFVQCQNGFTANNYANLHWKLTDIAEAGFSGIAISLTPCYLKIYTDNGVLNTPAAATTKYLISITYTIVFRGRF